MNTTPTASEMIDNLRDICESINDWDNPINARAEIAEVIRYIKIKESQDSASTIRESYMEGFLDGMRPMVPPMAWEEKVAAASTAWSTSLSFKDSNPKELS